MLDFNKRTWLCWKSLAGMKIIKKNDKIDQMWGLCDDSKSHSFDLLKINRFCMKKSAFMKHISDVFSLLVFTKKLPKM